MAFRNYYIVRFRLGRNHSYNREELRWSEVVNAVDKAHALRIGWCDFPHAAVRVVRRLWRGAFLRRRRWGWRPLRLRLVWRRVTVWRQVWRVI